MVAAFCQSLGVLNGFYNILSDVLCNIILPSTPGSFKFLLPWDFWTMQTGEKFGLRILHENGIVRRSGTGWHRILDTELIAHDIRWHNFKISVLFLRSFWVRNVDKHESNSQRFRSQEYKIKKILTTLITINWTSTGDVTLDISIETWRCSWMRSFSTDRLVVVVCWTGHWRHRTSHP